MSPRRLKPGRQRAATRHYAEVSDVLEDDGGSDEVPEVDVGFRGEAPELTLPGAELPEVPAMGVRLDASWELTKGQQIIIIFIIIINTTTTSHWINHYLLDKYYQILLVVFT